MEVDTIVCDQVYSGVIKWIDENIDLIRPAYILIAGWHYNITLTLDWRLSVPIPAPVVTDNISEPGGGYVQTRNLPHIAMQNSSSTLQL